MEKRVEKAWFLHFKTSKPLNISENRLLKSVFSAHVENLPFFLKFDNFSEFSTGTRCKVFYRNAKFEVLPQKNGQNAKAKIFLHISSTFFHRLSHSFLTFYHTPKALCDKGSRHFSTVSQESTTDSTKHTYHTYLIYRARGAIGWKKRSDRIFLKTYDIRAEVRNRKLIVKNEIANDAGW